MKVVLAAVQTLDVLDADRLGKTPDGDGTLMVARNKLSFAIRVEPEMAKLAET